MACTDALQSRVSTLSAKRFVVSSLLLQEQRQEANKQGGASKVEELEFICNGQAIPFDLSLAAIRSFLWRRSDSVVIQYRVYDPSKPAPPPLIKLP